MGKSYVRIALGSRLTHPRLCAFTGTANPRKFVSVRYQKTSWGSGIPILGWFWREPVVRLRFPASNLKAVIDRALKYVMIGLGILVTLSYVIGRTQARGSSSSEFPVPNPPESGESALKVFLVALAASIVFQIIRSVNLRAVRILNRDGNVVEVCFNREDYAREFCELNGLICHDQPYQRRQSKRGS